MGNIGFENVQELCSHACIWYSERAKPKFADVIDTMTQIETGNQQG